MEEATPILIQHMERYFGTIQGGFGPRDREVMEGPKVQVIECRGGSVRDVTVISTLGLSRFELASAVSEKHIRQELFLMVKDGQFSGNMPAVLHQIAHERRENSRAVLRGDAIRKEGTLFDSGDFVALYCTLPIYYPNEMWSCHTNERDIVLCWLLPIREQEWTFLTQNGWSKFEDLVDSAQCDLFDLNRPSVV
jgi:Suppressor of fused protein (SUFU)